MLNAQPEIVYNINDMGFLHGQHYKEKVICNIGRWNPCYTPDWNCEMVTVIQCISADPRVIPPMYIFLGGQHLLGRHAGVQDEEQATFAWSTTGWTDTEVGLECEGQNFEKYTIKMCVPLDWPPLDTKYYSAKSKQRIVILDRNSSHLT